MRACLCYEVSDRDGEEKCLQAIQENADFIDYCEQNPSDMLKAMFGGHALFTISDKTFDRMVEANNGRAGFHIHVSEGMNDVYDSLQNYGRRPVQRLQDHGILGAKTILGHCIHVNTAEMDIIKATGHHVRQQPRVQHGQRRGLLSGAAAVQARASSWAWAPTPTPTTCWRASRWPCAHPAAQRLPAQRGLVRGDGHALPATTPRWRRDRYFHQPLGVLKPGAAADVIVMDYKPFTPFSDANIDGHMLFGMTGRQCQTTMINGRILMKDREF